MHQGASVAGTDIDPGQHCEAMLDLPRNIGGSALSLDLRLGRVEAQMAGIHGDLIVMEISPI